MAFTNRKYYLKAASLYRSPDECKARGYISCIIPDFSTGNSHSLGGTYMIPVKMGYSGWQESLAKLVEPEIPDA